MMMQNHDDPSHQRSREAVQGPNTAKAPGNSPNACIPTPRLPHGCQVSRISSLSNDTPAPLGLLPCSRPPAPAPAPPQHQGSPRTGCTGAAVEWTQRHRLEVRQAKAFAFGLAGPPLACPAWLFSEDPVAMAQRTLEVPGALGPRAVEAIQRHCSDCDPCNPFLGHFAGWHRLHAWFATRYSDLTSCASHAGFGALPIVAMPFGLEEDWAFEDDEEEPIFLPRGHRQQRHVSQSWGQGHLARPDTRGVAEHQHACLDTPRAAWPARIPHAKLDITPCTLPLVAPLRRSS